MMNTVFYYTLEPSNHNNIKKSWATKKEALAYRGNNEYIYVYEAKRIA